MGSVITPPYRTSLLNSGDTTTTKDWWLFWKTLGDLGNAGMKMLTWGGHFDRPVASDMPDGAIYVESDRSGVIYQNQGGEWHYLAGTMWGTISPDTRPADLGVNDTGLDFRTTVTPSQEFMWSGNTWIEITALRYGTHAQRLAATNVWSGMAWIETDRGNSIYQNQAGVWHYLAGTMFGTLSPDQRPADLGVNDAGFDFRTNVAPAREFMWSQSAWVEITPSTGDVQFASSSASVALTTSPIDVPGCFIVLNRAGRYLINGIFNFTMNGAGDQSQYLLGLLNADGSDIGTQAVFISVPVAGIGLTGSTQSIYTAPTTGKVVKLRAYKTGGSGTSTIDTRSSISALWVSP